MLYSFRKCVRKQAGRADVIRILRRKKILSCQTSYRFYIHNHPGFNFCVTIGVTALILVLSVMNGFESEVRSKLIDADAHIRLRKYFTETIKDYQRLVDVAKKHPRVIEVSPAIFEESMVQSKAVKRPTTVKALDPSLADVVNNFKDKIIHGEFDFSKKEINGKNLNGIILGRYLADRLLATNLGEVVRLITLPKDGSIFSQPRVMEFYVSVSSSLAIMNLIVLPLL